MTKSVFAIKRVARALFGVNSDLYSNKSIEYYRVFFVVLKHRKTSRREHYAQIAEKH